MDRNDIEVTMCHASGEVELQGTIESQTCWVWFGSRNENLNLTCQHAS